MTESKKENNLERISGKYLIKQIQHVWHLESGYLYTIKELIFRPGKTVNNFLFVDRKRYVKPLIFLFFNSVIFKLIFHFFHIEYIFFNLNTEAASNNNSQLSHYLETKLINEWLNSHIEYTLIIIGIFISFWLKLFLRKRNLNLFEVLVMICYFLGQSLIFLSITALLEKVFKVNTIFAIGLTVCTLYLLFGITDFYGKKQFSTYINVVLSIILGIISYSLLLVVLSFLNYLTQ